jgi:protein-disulfide isomerase
MSQKNLEPPVGHQDHSLGGDAAAVTLVEYGDFECPDCGHAYPILKRVQHRLGDRLRFAFRHFPLGDIHPHAEHAAEATESVAALGGPAAFWAMHDLIFEHQHALDDASLARYAGQAGVDGEKVLADLREGRYRKLVRASFIDGVRSGGNGTPTFFIDGVRYDGDRDEESMVAALASQPMQSGRARS